MMGQAQPQKQLFSYHIDLDQRIRPDHPLRTIKPVAELTFVNREGLPGLVGRVTDAA